MHDDHQEMMDIVALSMPDAIWNFDDERVHAYLETLSHHASVHAVRYFNHEGELVEEIAKSGTALNPRHAFEATCLSEFSGQAGRWQT
ncbi:hypothetical protein HUS67_04605 [Cobetia marina]|uniref:hypothetical protein n=2 Tax=Halomonadaceae TaxID=28256 RepID=UPI001581A0A5|nr:hypothetical protein [Cobetia marina]NUJ55593.1 hypothetical protein [Cobetia marina]